MHPPRHEASEKAVGDFASAMGDRHENDPLHVRFGLEIKRATKLSQILDACGYPRERYGECGIPNGITAVRHERAREQAAHAVPDDHHVSHREIAAIRVHYPAQLLKLVAEISGTCKEWKSSGIKVMPKLIALTNFRIANQFVGQLLPGKRRGPQSMHHDDGNAIGRIR